MPVASAVSPWRARWRFLGWLARPAAWSLVLIGCGVLVSDILSLAIPWLQQGVLNAVIAGHLADAWRQLELWVAVAVGAKLAGVAHGLLSGRVRLRLANRAREEVSRHLLSRVRADELRRRGPSQVVQDVGYAAGAVDIVTYGIQWTVGLSTRVVGGLVAMSLLSPVILAAVAPFCVGYMVVPRLLARWIRRAEAREQDAAVAARTPVIEFATAADEVRLLGAADWCLQRLRAVWDRLVARQWQTLLAHTGSDGLNWCLQTAALLTAWAVGVAEVGTHHLSVGGLIAVSLYLMMLFDPLERVMSFQYHWVGWTLDVDRTLAVLNLSEMAEPDPLPADFQGPIEVRDVEVQYGSGADTALHVPHLRIPAGASTALLGPNGSGKSTLLKMLARLLPYRAGVVTLGGVDLRRIAPEAFFQGVTGMVAEPAVFTGTVRDNLQFARPGAGDAEIQAGLHAAGLGPWLASRPTGLETPLGANGHGLSSGQVQRLALARALLHGGAIWLLDEPTAAIDRASVREVWDSIRRSARTVVVATHDEALAAAADHIVDVEAGWARPRQG